MPTAKSERPNIIVICSDQHRADTIGAYGSAICRTPNLDRLAAQGVTFTRCYTNNPICSPARATLMTGRQSRRHGVPRNGYPLSETIPTFAGLLQSAGYSTCAIGKLHLTPHNRGVLEGPAYGFDHIENSEDPKIGPFLDWALRAYPQFEEYYISTLFNLPTNEAYWRNRRDFRKEVEPCRARHLKPLEISDTCNWGYAHYSPLPPEAHQTSWIANRAIAALERHDKAQPLLLWVGFQDPHNPFDPPAPFSRMYDPAAMPSPVGVEADDEGLPRHLQVFRRAFRTFTDRDWRTLKALYYGSVTFMDDAIGRIMAAVEARFDMANTIVIYTSDHGEFLGDHGICGKWAYHYEPATRVPMIWRGDDRWAAGLRREAILEQADFAPTLLAAAGLEPHAGMDGVSFLPLLSGASNVVGRGHAYIESFNGGPLDRTPDPDTWARTVRTDGFRCTFYPDPDAGELYDLKADPDECRNRFADPAYRPIVEEHRRILLARLIRMDHPLPPRDYDV
jgi:arylsulfatase A-like enzyme